MTPLERRKAAIAAFRSATTEEEREAAQADYDAAADAEDAEATAASASFMAELCEARPRGDQRAANDQRRMTTLGTFAPKPGFDADAFWRRIENLGNAYLPNTDENILPLPSEQKRALKQLQDRARKFAEVLNRPPSEIRHRLLAASAKKDSDINAKPDRFDALDRLDRAIAEFKWLCQVIDLAHDRIVADIQKAAPRGDRALSEFIREVTELYRRSAAAPGNPYTDENGEGHGELIRLLHAYCYPRVNKTWVAWVEAWRRATKGRKRAQRRKN